MPQPGPIVTQRVDLETVANVEQSRKHDAPFPSQSARRRSLDDLRVEGPRRAARKLPVCSNRAPTTASPLAWISVRVGAEIDEHLPDDLAWSVVWQVTVV